jgi:hypothetical protein
LEVDILEVEILEVDILEVNILEVNIFEVDILEDNILELDILEVDILEVDISTMHRFDGEPTWTQQLQLQNVTFRRTINSATACTNMGALRSLIKPT